MPRGSDAPDPEGRRGQAQTGYCSRYRIVTDAMKAGLQSNPSAGDHVIGDLLLGQVTGTPGVCIGVRLTHRCGT
jgi:hypothetical protein